MCSMWIGKRWVREDCVTVQKVFGVTGILTVAGSKAKVSLDFASRLGEELLTNQDFINSVFDLEGWELKDRDFVTNGLEDLDVKERR